jgi:hypothetical protein
VERPSTTPDDDEGWRIDNAAINEALTWPRLMTPFLTFHARRCGKGQRSAAQRDLGGGRPGKEVWREERLRERDARERWEAGRSGYGSMCGRVEETMIACWRVGLADSAQFVGVVFLKKRRLYIIL